jgi:glycosyltransferase involved in cell wall biosynthesis
VIPTTHQSGSPALAPARGSQEREARRRTLTVAINAQINPVHGGGVESALQGLMAHLDEQAHDERFLLLSTVRYAPDLSALAGKNQQVVPWPFLQKGYAPYRRKTDRWERWQTQAGPLGFGVDALHWGWWQARQALARMPDVHQTDAYLRAQGVDVIHFAYPIRFRTELPFLYEPWDLQHRHYPEFFGAGERRWRDQMYREGCEQAQLIVTATRWTKRDLVEQYGIDQGKIAVIPRGPWLTPAMPTDAQVADVRRALALPDRFALYPAMTFPHKNHLRLFEALALLRDRHGIVLPLVCTGRRYDPHWPIVQQAIARHRLEGQIFMLEAVSYDTLSALFKAAWALIFPSLFEGLGLPIVESLQYGLPVIAADATCLPEVAGDAALYFDGQRVESMVKTLLAAHRDPAALERTRHAAPAALARLSWPKSAATFVACYRSVAGLPLTSEHASLYAEAIES